MSLLLFIYRSASRQLDVKLFSDACVCLVLSAAGGLGAVFTVTCNLFILPQAIPSLFLLLLLTRYFQASLGGSPRTRWKWESTSW